VLAVLVDLSHYGNTWEQRGAVESGISRYSSRPPPPCR
jgi:hypothetical protein